MQFGEYYAISDGRSTFAIIISIEGEKAPKYV